MLAFTPRSFYIVLLLAPASLSFRATRVEEEEDLDRKGQCADRAEVDKAIAGVKSTDWKCTSWAHLTAEMKRTKDRNKMEKWGALRKALVDNAFFCARQGKDAEISCPGSQDIDSDLDCNVQGSNPAEVILQTAHNIVDFLKQLKCSIGDPTQPLAAVEYFFDANFYGDLTSVDAGLMRKIDWWGGGGQPLFQPAKTKAGAQTYILKELCSATTEPLMRARVLTRIREQVLRLAPAAFRQAPRPYDESAMMGALSSLYANLQKQEGGFTDHGKVEWEKLFNQLMDVAELQREAYLTPACTFKIVIAGQRGIQPSQAVPDDQKECINRISNLEQLAFIFQHISGDSSGGAPTLQSYDASLFRFLVKSSKYFARMVDWGGSACCQELIQLSPQVKEKRAILAENDALYTKYLNAFRQCAEFCKVRARTESDIGQGETLGKLLEGTSLPWNTFIKLMDPNSLQELTFNQLITLLWRLLHNMNGIVTWQARDNLPSISRRSVVNSA